MSVKRCGNCNHATYYHEPKDLELCRKCDCPGFLTPTKGQLTLLDRAIAVAYFAHHHHGFDDESCTTANCSAAAFLADHFDPIRHGQPIGEYVGEATR